MSELIEGEDFYWEGPLLVFTAAFHLRKGQCCGSGCRHCPYDPRWTKGTTTPAAAFQAQRIRLDHANEQLEKRQR